VILRIGQVDDLGELGIGASLAVSGVCLTLIESSGSDVAVELSPETLRRTTLGGLKQGSKVNLEPAMRVGEVLGGHWVQGHVDATTEVLERVDLEEHCEMTFALPEDLKAFVVEKGSVALDGVSLTIASLEDDRFMVALIPHTLEVTTLSDLRRGDRVNLEVDILAKYVHRALDVAGRLTA